MVVKTGLNFSPYKFVWSTENRLLVFSWDLDYIPADPTESGLRNYNVMAFVVSGSTYDLVGTHAGQFYGNFAPFLDSLPTFSISPSLQTISIYALASSNTNFARLMTFDYSAKTTQAIELDMDWMISTNSALSVSDYYIYVRNVANYA